MNEAYPSKDLRGPEFKITVRRLRSQRQDILQSATHHEYLDSMERYNDEINRYMSQIDDINDRRYEILVNLLLTVSESPAPDDEIYDEDREIWDDEDDTIPRYSPSDMDDEDYLRTPEEEEEFMSHYEGPR